MFTAPEREFECGAAMAECNRTTSETDGWVDDCSEGEGTDMKTKNMLHSGEDNTDSPEQDTERTDYECDFSYLPEPVWLKVMEFLPLSDRYHVSMTCHALYDIFNHPSNWKSAHLLVLGGMHNYGMSYSFVPDKFRIIVDKFGHFIQRLTICLNGHLVSLKDSAREILERLSQVCRLEHLVLEVGLLTTDYHLDGITPVHEDVRRILMLIATAFRLKRIEILSWPMYPQILSEEEVNIFEVMKKNPKLEDLESLSLFWMKNKHWTERSPLLPSPDVTKSLVSHFRALRHLALRSPMLSDQLLEELASPSRERLQSLQILLMHSSQDRHSTNISSSPWKALCKRSPKLEVECAVMSRIPDMEMAAMLQPEVPLVTFTILKYARCSQALMDSLRQKFHRTLRSFICYADPTDCGSELLELVKTCSNLDTLVFHGQIHCNTLMSIAKLRNHWKKFEFVEKCIITEAEAEFDDDSVIGQSADGDLVQLDLVRFHGQQSETERKQMLDSLSAEMSRRFDYGWQPCWSVRKKSVINLSGFSFTWSHFSIVYETYFALEFIDQNTPSGKGLCDWMCPCILQV